MTEVCNRKNSVNGEAQRVKLSTELSRCATGKTLYLIDEPTTGLSFYDFQKLLDVLQDEEGEFLYNGFGYGWILSSPKYLNSSSFNDFKSYCGNFGFGFMSINNSDYLEKLKYFSEKYKPKTSKINFLKYVDNFYQQVIRVNPNEAARLFGDVEN